MQQDFNHFRGFGETIYPYQPIVGDVDDTSNPHAGGFIGGFTPHYSPVSNPSLPTSSFQNPLTPLPQYNALQPPFIDHFTPPPLPTIPAGPSYPRLADYTDPDNVPPLASNSHSQPILSQNSRVERMKPHLQFMVGPLLRYDTIENGIWRGAALIVSECVF